MSEYSWNEENYTFSWLSSLYNLFKSEIPWTFPDNVIDFTDKPVVQCDIPVVKNSFVDDGDTQIVTKNFDRNI